MAARKRAKELARFRASDMNRIEVCPASYAQSIGAPDYTTQYEALGIAFHQAMAQAASKGRGGINVKTIASMNGTDERELRDLLNRFTFDPTGGEAEVAVEIRDEGVGVHIRGILDWRRIVETKASVVDYKTTHLIEEEPEPIVNRQLHVYSGATLEECGLEEVEMSLALVRRGDYGWTEPFGFTRDEWPDVKADLFAICKRAIEEAKRPIEKRRFVMSHHCSYCRGRPTCPAVSAELRNAMALTSGKEVDIELTTDNAAKMFMVARLADKASTALKDGIRLFVEELGPIPAAEPGKILDVRSRMNKPRLNEEAVEIAQGEAMEVVEQVVGEFLASMAGHLDADDQSRIRAFAMDLAETFGRTSLRRLQEREKVESRVLNLYAAPRPDAK